MSIRKVFVTLLVVLTMLTAAALTDQVTVDYDHSIHLSQLPYILMGEGEDGYLIWDARAKQPIDNQLAAKGWTQVTTGGDVTLVAVQTTHTQQQLDTYYDGLRGRR